MHKIFRTKSFKRDYKKLTKNEKDLLKMVIPKLVAKETLDEKYRDHKLIGDYLSCRECHIKSDLLLVYRYDDDILELALVRTGSHSELFR